MKTDIKNEPIMVKIEDKEYKLEYDYAALSTLENETGRGVYEIYNSVISNRGLKLDEAKSLLSCAMLKHHKKGEIDLLDEKFKAHPGLFFSAKECAILSFILPLLPPEIMEKTIVKQKSKKKTTKR